MYTDLLATFPGEIHGCLYGSLVLVFTIAIPHHGSKHVPIVVGGGVIILLREVEVFSWELFREKNKPFLKVTP